MASAPRVSLAAAGDPRGWRSDSAGDHFLLAVMVCRKRVLSVRSWRASCWPDAQQMIEVVGPRMHGASAR